MLDRQKFDAILAHLSDLHVSPSELVLGLVQNAGTNDLNTVEILDALLENPSSSDSVSTWADRVVKRRYTECIRQLVKPENGWHFSALRASGTQLKDFRIEDMARDLERLAPELWGFLDVLLSARSKTNWNDHTGEEELPNTEDEDELEDDGDPVATSPRKQRNAQERRKGLLTIRKVTIISIIMLSTNQKCNVFESVFGIFLHACNTPVKVIQSLAHMGISISVQAINNAIKSLDKETHVKLRELGQTLLVSYAYDNFDINFTVSTPTVDKSIDTLTHLTSGDLIRLEHGVTKEDLRCSKYLWERSKLNPHADPELIPRQRTCADLEKLHPETRHVSGLTRRERFNAWRFRSDLIHHGPDFFRRYLPDLGEPEAIEQIPVTKMYHVPARATDMNQSTIKGNMGALDNLREQGGVGDPNEGVPMDVDSESNSEVESDIVDISEYSQLTHGDLGTDAKVRSILERRALEKTAVLRYQYIVFVMGLFHLKMACADAFWRIFLEPLRARLDANSCMKFAALHRTKETGKLGSSPGFRRVHEVIREDGTALRLDCWRVEAEKRNKSWKTLDDFAASNPSYGQITEMSERIAVDYVAGGKMYRHRERPKREQDMQKDNIMIMHKYMLLYEEMSWAMNFGDIGRVETLFPSWIYIFKATGKHKYANTMVKFLTDVHFVYPEGLRHAIRYNILVNPTGKPGKFRGVDWVVELNNLFTKYIHGGSGSNYTKERVIMESTLIDVYRSCIEDMERNFHLTDLTKRHGPPDLRATYKALERYMTTEGPNEYRPGRTSEYEIPDMLSKGMGIYYSNLDSVEESEDIADVRPEAEDLGAEDE